MPEIDGHSDIPSGLPSDPTASLRPSSVSANSAAQAFLNENPLKGRSDSIYVLRREVGEGSFGEVWEALQVTLNRVVAVKRPRNSASTGSSVEQVKASELEFYREALVSARLDHPNIVPVYDLGLDASGRPLLAMKLVKGSPWNTLLSNDLTLPVAERLARNMPILISVSQAVAFAHSRGVVHRDLKPSQVMVGSYGEVFLMDWGLAVAVTPQNEGETLQSLPFATPIDSAPNPAGTVAYMAPEQTESNCSRIGTWTDIYLLGGMLFELLTGTYPHPQERALQAFHHAALGKADHPQTRTEEPLPEELCAICTKAMAREPANRFGSALEFISALQAYTSGVNRREESLRLSTQLIQQFENGPVTYELLEKCDAGLQTALNLWSENATAEEAHEKVLETFCKEAIRHRDLKLAMAQALRLRSDGIQAQILNEISLHEHRYRVEALQRKVAIFAALILLISATSLGVYSARKHAKARQLSAMLQADIAEKENKTKLQQEEQERAKQQAILLNRIGKLHAQTAAFAEKVEREIPFPTEIDRGLDWSILYLNSNSEKLKQFREERESLRHERSELISSGVSLPSEPFPVLLFDGIVELYDSGNSNDTSDAYLSFLAASHAEPDRVEAQVGMAMAAARAGENTSASQSLHIARDMMHGSTGWPFDQIYTMEKIVAERSVDTLKSSPDDFIIEAINNRSPHGHYEELNGNWSRAESGWQDKSFVPGVKINNDSGNRRYFFYSPFAKLATSAYAAARFYPDLKKAGKYFVSIAWPAQANAAPVYVSIHYDGGEKTFPLVQDGFGWHEKANGNAWINLGDFNFVPGDNQYVEVRVCADVRPLTPLRYGEAYADAVCFSHDPIKGSVSDLPLDKNAKGFKPEELLAPSPDLTWETSLNSAKQKAAQSHKKILLFAFYPISSFYPHVLIRSRDYCINRLFADEKVKQVMREGYEIVKVNIEEHPELQKSLSMDGPATCIIICDSNGAPEKRLSAGDLLLSTRDFAQFLRSPAAIASAR